MLTIRMITTDAPDLPEVTALMERAFPANERVPMRLLLPEGRQGAELWGFYEGGRFCGFISLLSWRDITHILYFAMEEGLRGRGYGSQALGLVHALKKGRRIIADLEAENQAAPNAVQRSQRRRFYQRNGYVYSGVSYGWRQESYEIFAHGGKVSEAEFEAFWDYFG